MRLSFLAKAGITLISKGMLSLQGQDASKHFPSVVVGSSKKLRHWQQPISQDAVS